MKLKNLFPLTIIFSIQFACMSLVASEENIEGLLALPQEIIAIIGHNCDFATIASLKRSCKALKQNIGYRHLPKNLIENEDYDRVSDGLISTAHQYETSDHEALRFNNPEKRIEALGLLGWNEISSIEESMDAYRGVAAKTPPILLKNDVLENTLVLKILRSGVNPNIQDSYGYTPLHKACLSNSIKAVKVLVSNKNTNLNLENQFGHTPLDLKWMTLMNREIVDILSANGARHNWRHYTVPVLSIALIPLTVYLLHLLHNDLLAI